MSMDMVPRSRLNAVETELEKETTAHKKLAERATAELTFVHDGLRAILLARQQFEGNLEGALDEIEHRAKGLLKGHKSATEPLAERVDVLDGHDEGLERAARICEGTANQLKPDLQAQRDALLIVARSIRELKRLPYVGDSST